MIPKIKSIPILAIGLTLGFGWVPAGTWAGPLVNGDFAAPADLSG